MITRHVRRSKLQIYYDILKAINHESELGKVRPTRVQNLCNMSYDKFSKYLPVYQLKITVNEYFVNNNLMVIPRKGFMLIEKILLV